MREEAAVSTFFLPVFTGSCSPVYCTRVPGIPGLFGSVMNAHAAQSCYHPCQFCFFAVSLLHTSTSLSTYIEKPQRIRVNRVCTSGLLALFISPASQIMPQIQVLSLVNRGAATAHQPFMLSHVFTWALNMPGQDIFFRFHGWLKAFCQLPVMGV